MRQYIIITTIVIMFLLFIYFKLLIESKIKSKTKVNKLIRKSVKSVKSDYITNPYKVLENKYTLKNLDTDKKVTDAKKKVIWRISNVFIDVNGKKVIEPPSEPLSRERSEFLLGIAKSTIRKRYNIVSEETGLPIDPFPIDMRDNSVNSTTNYLSLKLLTNNFIDLSDTFIKKMHLGFNYYLTPNTANDAVELKKVSKFGLDPLFYTSGTPEASIIDGNDRTSLTSTFNNSIKNNSKNFDVVNNDINNSKWTLVKIKPDDTTDNTYHILVKGTTKYLCSELNKRIVPISKNDDELLLQFSKWLRSSKSDFNKYLQLSYNYKYTEDQFEGNEVINQTFKGGFRIKHVYSNSYIKYSNISGKRRLKLSNISISNEDYKLAGLVSDPEHISSEFNFDNSLISNTNYNEDGILYFGNFRGSDQPISASFILVPINKPSDLKDSNYSDNDIYYAMISLIKIDFPTKSRKAIFVLEMNPILKTSLLEDTSALPQESPGMYNTRNIAVIELFSKFFDIRKEYKFTCCNLIDKIYGDGSTPTKYSRQICKDTKHAIVTGNVEGERLCIPFMNDYCKASEDPNPVKANIITNIKEPACGCYDKTSLIPLLSPLYRYLTDPENAALLDENEENGNIANKEKCFFSKCQDGGNAFMTPGQKNATCPAFCGIIKTNIAEANAVIRESGNTYEVSCNSNSSGPASIVLNECSKVVTFPQGQCNKPCSQNQTITRLEQITRNNNPSQICEGVPNNSLLTNIDCNTIDPSSNPPRTFCSAFPEPPPTPVVPPVDPVVPPVDPPVVPPTGDVKDEGLSNGAIAGITVGSVVGVSVIGFVVYKYYKSRKQVTM